MAMRQCAHTGCTCPAEPDSEFCSAGCRTAELSGMKDACPCGHPGCEHSTSNASAEGRPASTITQS